MDKDREALIRTLEDKAIDIRQQAIRLTGLCGGAHIGGSLSVTETLLVLYNYVLRHDPQNPKWDERDRFVLSKGHAALGFYPVLCDQGYFTWDELATFNQFGSPFGMHPDMHKVPGVEMSTGALGHGICVSVGLALGGKLKKASWRVFCLIGDGECDEGSVWEAAMSAAHFKLGNLTVIVDRNGLSLDGPTEEIMALEPLADKWRAFGWAVREVDGHDVRALMDTFDALPGAQADVPHVIIAHTVKGCGASCMEGVAAWHYGGINATLEAELIAELESRRGGGV
jgi:transketolase